MEQTYHKSQNVLRGIVVNVKQSDVVKLRKQIRNNTLPPIIMVQWEIWVCLQ